MPIKRKEKLIVELTLMQKLGTITVLAFSMYGSPNFAQRKPNGKLRLLVGLRKTNTLNADGDLNTNHPGSTFSDAAQHLAGKFFFCNLDCSQSYHCLEIADQSQWKSLQSFLPAQLLQRACTRSSQICV